MGVRLQSAQQACFYLLLIWFFSLLNTTGIIIDLTEFVRRMTGFDIIWLDSFQIWFYLSINRIIFTIDRIIFFLKERDQICHKYEYLWIGPLVQFGLVVAISVSMYVSCMLSPPYAFVLLLWTGAERPLPSPRALKTGRCSKLDASPSTPLFSLFFS